MQVDPVYFGLGFTGALFGLQPQPPALTTACVDLLIVIGSYWLTKRDIVCVATLSMLG